MARVHLLAPALADLPDARDAIAEDSDVGAIPRKPGAIDHGAAADHEVVTHPCLSAVCAVSRP